MLALNFKRFCQKMLEKIQQHALQSTFRLLKNECMLRETLSHVFVEWAFQQNSYFYIVTANSKEKKQETNKSLSYILFVERYFSIY